VQVSIFRRYKTGVRYTRLVMS